MGVWKYVQHNHKDGIREILYEDMQNFLVRMFHFFKKGEKTRD